MTVALVLGAAVGPDGRASPTLHLRVSHAVSLYRQGAVSAICISGGQGRHGASEAEVGLALARAMGVPASDLLSEAASRSTLENLTLSAPLLTGRRIVIVSNRWHLPRALIVARLLGLNAQGSAPAGRMSWPRTLRAALREAAAIPVTSYRAVRYISARPKSAHRSGR